MKADISSPAKCSTIESYDLFEHTTREPSRIHDRWRIGVTECFEGNMRIGDLFPTLELPVPELEDFVLRVGHDCYYCCQVDALETVDVLLNSWTFGARIVDLSILVTR